MDNISQWLAQARASGLSDAQIREQLQKSGWNDSQINQLLVGPAPSMASVTGTSSQYVSVVNNMFSRTWTMVKHTIVPYIIMALIGAGFYLAINFGLFQLLGGVTNAIAWIVSYLLMGVVFSFVLYGSVVIMISEDRHIGLILTTTLKGFLKFLATYALANVIILGGMLLFLVPGILMSLAFVFLPFVIAKENVWGMAALKRCYILARGHRGTIFIALLFLSILWMALGFGFSTILFGAAFVVPEQNETVVAITSGVGAVFMLIIYLLSPLIQSAVIAVIYGDLRTLRPEGSDQQVGDKGKKFMIAYVVTGIITTILVGWGISALLTNLPELLDTSFEDLTNTQEVFDPDPFSSDADSQRVLDVYGIWTNLDEYYIQNNSYPSSIAEIAYMFPADTMPVDPVSGEAYYYETNGSDFVLCAEIDEDTTGTPWCLDASYEFVCDTIDEATGRPDCIWNVPYSVVQ